MINKVNYRESSLLDGPLTNLESTDKKRMPRESRTKKIAEIMTDTMTDKVIAKTTAKLTKKTAGKMASSERGLETRCTHFYSRYKSA